MTKFIASCLFATSFALNLKSYQTGEEVEEFFDETFNNSTTTGDYYNEHDATEQHFDSEMASAIASDMWGAIEDFGHVFSEADNSIRQAHANASESLNATYEDMLRVAGELEESYHEMDATLWVAQDIAQGALDQAAQEIWVLVGHDEEKSMRFQTIADDLQGYADYAFGLVRTASHDTADAGETAIAGIITDMHAMGDLHAADDHQWTELSQGVEAYIQENASAAEEMLHMTSVTDEERAG